MIIYRHRVTGKPFIEISKLSSEEGLFITPGIISSLPRIIQHPYEKFSSGPNYHKVEDFNTLSENEKM